MVASSWKRGRKKVNVLEGWYMRQGCMKEKISREQRREGGILKYSS